MESDAVAFAEMHGKFDQIMQKLETVTDKQDEMAQDIAKIKEAVYNPDTGLYARLTRLDSRLDALEGWKATNTKVIWILVTIGAGLVLNTGWSVLF